MEFAFKKMDFVSQMMKGCGFIRNSVLQVRTVNFVIQFSLFNRNSSFFNRKSSLFSRKSFEIPSFRSVWWRFWILKSKTDDLSLHKADDFVLNSGSSGLSGQTALMSTHSIRLNSRSKFIILYLEWWMFYWEWWILYLIWWILY